MSLAWRCCCWDGVGIGADVVGGLTALSVFVVVRVINYFVVCEVGWGYSPVPQWTQQGDTVDTPPPSPLGDD